MCVGGALSYTNQKVDILKLKKVSVAWSVKRWTSGNPIEGPDRAEHSQTCIPQEMVEMGR